MLAAHARLAAGLVYLGRPPPKNGTKCPQDWHAEIPGLADLFSVKESFSLSNTSQENKSASPGLAEFHSQWGFETF